MINLIWIILIILGLGYSVLSGNGEAISKTILEVPDKAIKLIISLSGSIIFWSGMLEIAKDGGFLKIINKIILFFIKPLFKNIDKDSKVYEYISGNIACNILGLGSAATPLGLKAMVELDEINKHKETPSYEMCVFILLNTASFTLIPSTIITLRENYQAKITYELVPYIFIVGLISTFIAILTLKINK